MTVVPLPCATYHRKDPPQKGYSPHSPTSEGAGFTTVLALCMLCDLWRPCDTQHLYHPSLPIAPDINPILHTQFLLSPKLTPPVSRAPLLVHPFNADAHLPHPPFVPTAGYPNSTGRGLHRSHEVCSSFFWGLQRISEPSVLFCMIAGCRCCFLYSAVCCAVLQTGSWSWGTRTRIFVFLIHGEGCCLLLVCL